MSETNFIRTKWDEKTIWYYETDQMSKTSCIIIVQKIIKTDSFSKLFVVLMQWALSIIFNNKSHQYYSWLFGLLINFIFWSKLVALLMASVRFSCHDIRNIPAAFKTIAKPCFSGVWQYAGRWSLILTVHLIQVGNNRNDHFRYISVVRVCLIEVSG